MVNNSIEVLKEIDNRLDKIIEDLTKDAENIKRLADELHSINNNL